MDDRSSTDPQPLRATSPVTSIRRYTLSCALLSLVAVTILMMAARPIPARIGPRIILGPPQLMPAPGDTAAERVEPAGEMAIGPEGRIFTFNNRVRVLRAYTPSGASEGSYSTDAPDEPRLRAVAMDAAIDGTVHILSARQRIHAFHLERGTFTETASFPIEIPANDLCALKDEIVVVGVHKGKLVHRYSRAGRYLGSVGVVDSLSTAVQEVTFTGNGLIACLDELRMVVVGSTMLSTLHAFSLDGERSWSFAVPAFRGVDVESDPVGVVNVGRDGVADAVSSILPMGAFLAVQIFRPRTGGDRAQADVQTILLSGGKGVPHAVQFDLPQLLDSAPSHVAGRNGSTPSRAVSYRFSLEESR